jgi:hypothetical protein
MTSSLSSLIKIKMIRFTLVAISLLLVSSIYIPPVDLPEHPVPLLETTGDVRLKS